MDIQRYGIILNVENFDECVAFYRNLFDLKVMFSKIDGNFRLTCLEFGKSYLMIETEGFSEEKGKSIDTCPTKFRFNVPNIHSALEKIESFGFEAEIVNTDWGSTINLYDPDGNRIGIRDEAGFTGQLGSEIE